MTSSGSDGNDQNQTPENGINSLSRQGLNIKKLAPLVILISVIILVIAMGWHRELTLTNLAEHRNTLQNFVDTHYLAALGCFLGAYIVMAALSLPGGLVFTITGGFLFGAVIGTMASVSAATIGATIIFLVARAASQDFIERHAGEKLRRVREGLRKDAISYLLFMRLVPLFPFWLVNLAPALAGVGLRTYVVVSFIGIIPASLAFNLVGAGLDSVIAAEEANRTACIEEGGNETTCPLELDASSLITTEVLLAFAALGIVALIPVVARRIRNKKTSSQENGPENGS